MSLPPTDRYRAHQPRGRAAILALGLEGLIVAALIFGLAGHRPGAPHQLSGLVAIELDQSRPAKKRPPDPVSGGSVSVLAAAKPMAAYPNVIAPRQTPVPASRLSGPEPGGAGSAGEQAGVGSSGGGGSGSGTGPGTGDGADGGSDPEWIGGKIKDRDYPKAAREAHISGTTVAEVAVDAAGRPTGCRIIQTSGSRELDAATCRLILQRFRFSPARNAAGTAISGAIEYEQEWDAPPPPDD